MTPDQPSYSLGSELRAHDPDRWISSRFVGDEARRATVAALYALDNELARVRAAASNPLAAEIRLAWWLEELEGAVRGGAVAANPILQTLARSLGPALPVRTLERIIEARRLALGDAPADEQALVQHLEDTAGAIMVAAATTLAPDWTDHAQLLNAGRAWGWARAARGLEPVPADWADSPKAEIGAHIAHRVREALHVARADLRSVPSDAFPALAHLALARSYASGRTPSELEKRGRITLAVLRGRV
jgi:phytoene synthase